MRETKSTNPELLQLITSLKKQSREQNVSIWSDVAARLSKPSRQRIAVNLSKLNRYADENDTLLVPGKLLAVGTIDRAVTVAAFSASEKAKAKLAAAKAKYLSIAELIEKNPAGSKVKIIG
ncbi:MAG: 50S ribosomal protein L18e [Candidatus Bathyarchaeota archaeon]|nr:50S ribosomal protein L18e [Candidatus Bathyarchaeota archaeon]